VNTVAAPDAEIRSLRVLIADDHAAARAGVRESVEEGGFEVCAEAANAQEAIDLALRERPDACLLDVHMPGEGIRAATEISAALPDCAVVMLTVSRNDSDLFHSLRAGAAGYLLKDTDPARLPDALRGVIAGEAAMPRALVARLIHEFRERGTRRLPLIGGRGIELTSREWQVLDLLADGQTTAQIAARLFVSPVTVRRHISSIVEKLDAPNRDAAVRLFRESGASRCADGAAAY
jgi:DNA-binding NarL/FixJ family response regulator